MGGMIPLLVVAWILPGQELNLNVASSASQHLQDSRASFPVACCSQVGNSTLSPRLTRDLVIFLLHGFAAFLSPRFSCC
jgi:hypothetical protein